MASSDTRPDVEPPLASPVEQLGEALPQEMYVYQLGVQRLYVRDAEMGVEVYKRAGSTIDPEAMVAHDGPVIVDGSFRLVEETEYGAIQTHHPHGGRMARLDAEASSTEAVLLEEVERRV